MTRLTKFRFFSLLKIIFFQCMYNIWKRMNFQEEGGGELLGTFPKGIFPNGTSQMTISQVATSQMCNFPSGNFPKVRIGPQRRRRLQWERALRLGWERGPSAVARTGARTSAATRTDVGSCCLGNCTFGKLPLRKNH